MLGKTKVSRARRNVRGIGVARAAQRMSSCEIAENRKLAGLGARQRQALIDALHTLTSNHAAEESSPPRPLVDYPYPERLVQWAHMGS